MTVKMIKPARLAYILLPWRLVFFYSYKAGNTSLVHWLYEYAKPRSKGGVAVRAKRMYLNSPNNSISMTEGVKLIRNHGFRGVALARDPYSRAVSAYLNKFVVDGEVWRKSPESMERFARDLIGGDERFSFIDYLEKLSARTAAGERIDPHFAPQVPAYLQGVPFFQHLLRLESIDEDLGALIRKYRMPPAPFPRHRATASATNGAESLENASSTSCFDLSRDEARPTSGQLLCPRAIGLINELYASDFETFGYARRSI
jgi:hypothetical protein